LPDEASVRLDGVGKKFCADGRLARQYAWRDLKARFWSPARTGSDLRPSEFWAFRDVSLSVKSGERLGILGLNGVGKSTLLRLLAGRLLPTEGRIETCGTIASLSATGLGFRPRLSGRENIFLAASVYGHERSSVEGVIDEIIAFADIGRFIDSPLGAYSSGMASRLGFAITAVLEPDILLVDEALAVGDLAFQRKCLAQVRSFVERGGVLVLVTHDPHLAGSICDTSLLLHEGRARVQPVAEGVLLYGEILREKEKALLPHKGAGSAKASPDGPHAPLTVTLLSVDVQSSDGSAPVTGRPATFVLGLSAKESVLAHFSVMIETEDGESVVMAFGRAPGEEPLQLPRGASEIVGPVEHLTLAPGRFALRGILLDAATGVAFDAHARNRVEVQGPPSLRTAGQLRIRQLTAPPEPRWQVRTALSAIEAAPADLSETEAS
jgi:ABC-type polysaccharide/polyol phosphate transport system ATPase subunit